jgi:hypothetical protein
MAILRGILASFDADTYRADAWLDGSAARTTTGLAVNRGLAAEEMVAGRGIVIETGGEGDTASWVIIAVFGDA